MMKFSLIVCTYMRREPLLKLLQSVNSQSLYPDEILIVDGSRHDETQNMIRENHFTNLKYFLVGDENRGLTRQRNFGIKNTGTDIEIVCFLDDDIVLEPEYFKELINTYQLFPEALGVGGYIIEDIQWIKTADNYEPAQHEFF